MSFSNILGQDLAVGLFKKAIREGKLAHAYLLTGPDGVGKKSLAKEVAKALNCHGFSAQLETEGSWPCDLCRECHLIDLNQFPDVTFLTPENKMLKIEAIRQLQQAVALKPFESNWRVAIVEDIDQFTSDAAHAFLKILEEPPSGVFFFLTTRYRERIFLTIQSRCQMVRFNPIPNEILEKKKFPQAVIHLAQGSFGNAFYWSNSEVETRRRETLQSFFSRRSLSPNGERAASKEEEKSLIAEKLFLLETILRDLLIWKKAQNESLLIHWDYREEIRQLASQLKVNELKEGILKLDPLSQGLDLNASLKLLQGVLELELTDLIRNK